MSNLPKKRSTIYLEADVYTALRLKSVHKSCSFSKLVNDAIKQSISEDDLDSAVFEERKNESSRSFEDVVRDLKKNGKI